MSTEIRKNKTETAEYDEFENLLRIGDFAKLANINRNTLAFYIKKGLIKPAYTGENKYKYFLPGQVQTINLIKYMRRCMMPLDDIKDILSDPSRENMLTHVRLQIACLEQQIGQLNAASDYMMSYRRNAKKEKS